MRRGTLFLCALSAALLHGPWGIPASYGQESNDDELEDEFAFLDDQEIVLSAAKHKQRIGFSPASVVVITRKDIEESGAVTLVELLRRYPAVHVYVTDPLYPTSMIRGTIRVLVIVDGREVNLELYPAPFYEIIPVGLEDIERIEIVMGPNSALYGPNAVSAVINITTRKPSTGFKADLSLAGGEFGTLQVGGVLAGGFGPVAMRGMIRLDRARSWMDREVISKDLLKARYTLSLDLGPSRLTADAGMVEGGGCIYGVMGDMDFSKLVLAHSTIQYEHGDFKAMVYWYGLRTDFDVEFDLTMIWPDGSQDEMASTDPFILSGDTLQAEAQYDLDLFDDMLLLIGGLDFRYTNYRSDQLVDPVIEEYRAGIFVHGELKLFDQLLLTVGGRFDWNSVTDMAFSPRGAVVYNPAGEHFLRLSAATSFRKPTLIETSANFQITPASGFQEIEELFETRGISNANLENEILTGFELGYRGAVLEKALRLAADVYFNMNRNWISFETDINFRPPPLQMQIDLDNSRVGYANAGDDFNLFGFTLSVEGEPVEELTLFFRSDFRYEWYTKDGARALKTPLWQGTLGGTLRLPFDFAIHLTLAHVTSRKDDVRNPLSGLEPAIWLDMPSRTYMMAALGYRLYAGSCRIDLGLTFFNPFGGRFREKAGLMAPDGSNFGGEALGPRAMLTARLLY